MKKALSAVLFGFVVVLLLVVVAPIYGGKKAKIALDQLIAHVNATAPGSADWHSYEQGWFSSEGVLYVDLAAYLDMPAAANAETLIVPLQLELSHGPVIISDGLTLGWFEGRWYLNSEHEAWVKDKVQVEGKGPFFTSSFKMALSGVVAFREQTLPFSVAANDSLFSMTGYHGQGTYRPYGALIYHGSFTKASLLSHDGNILVEGADVGLISHLDERRGTFAVPGEAALSLDRVVVTRDDNPIFTLDDLELATSFVVAKEKPEVGDVGMRLEFGRSEFLGDTVNDGALEISLHRMSLSFYEKYMTLVQDVEDGESDASSLQGLQILALVNQELLPFGPELQLKKMQFATKEGQFSMNGHLRVLEDAAKGQANPFSVFKKIDAQLNILVDKPLAFRLAEQRAAKEIDEESFAGGAAFDEKDREAAIQSRAATQIEALLGQGFIVDKGEQFQTRFSFEKGVAVINGKAIPLPF